jgi:hypothetical protein
MGNVSSKLGMKAGKAIGAILLIFAQIRSQVLRSLEKSRYQLFSSYSGLWLIVLLLREKGTCIQLE